MDPALDNTNNGAYPSLPATSNSSVVPQSPNTLAMSLLNNLMQIQGLENSIVQQQLSNPGQGTPPSMSSSNTASQGFNGSNTSNSTLLLEQQIKLSQLQQLQQLQNQIFQQQIALISGQSPSILPSSPIQQTSPENYTGLPTPGPSGEIRPQRLSMDFLSSSSMSGFMEPLPRAHIPLSPPMTSSTSSSHPQDQLNSSSTPNSHNQPSPNPNLLHHLNVNSSSSNTHSHTRQGSGGATLSLQRQLQALSTTSPQHLYPQQQQNTPSYLHHHQATTSFPQSQRQSSSATSANPGSTSSPMYPPISPMQNPVSPMLYGVGTMSSPNPNPNLGTASNPNSKLNVNQSPNLFGSHGQSHSHRPSLSSSSSQQQQQQSQHNPNPQIRGLSSSMSITAPHSAPESLAFQIYTGPIPGGGNGGNGIPGLTLGPSGVPLDSIDMTSAGGPARRMSLSSSPRHPQGQGYSTMNNHHNHAHGHNQGQGLHMPVQMQILDQDISPLTSPWLGAHPTGSSSGSISSAGSKSAIHRSTGSLSMTNVNAGAGSKRTASGSGDEGGSARKKQSPAIRPTLQMSVINPTHRGVDSGRFDRDRESGSTSPLALGAGGKSGNTPPPAKEGDYRSGSGAGEVGERDGDVEGGVKRNKRMSRSGSGTASGSASGSVSPDPERDAAAAKQSRRMSNSVASGRKPYRGSKSTNSTPLLKSTPTSGAGMTSLGMAGMSMTPMMKAMNAKAVSRSRSKSKSGGVIGAGAGVGSGGGFSVFGTGAGGDPVHDTPSPVDLNDEALDSRSMPPPPLPASVSSGGQPNNGGNGHINMEVDMNMNMRMMGVGEGRDREGMNGMGFGGMMSELGDGMNMNMNNDSMGMSMGMPMGMGVGGDMSGDMGMGGMHSMGVGVGGMHSMGGMAMDMAGMNGMNMDMDMSMGMGEMDMNAFGGIGGMDMSGMDFGQLSQSNQQQQQQQQGQDQGPARGDHHHQHNGAPSSANSSSAQLHQNDQQQQQQHNQQESTQQQPLVPVTPASIMNLGRLGINNTPARLGSASASTGAVSGQAASASAASTRQTKAKKDAAAAALTTTTRSGRVSTRRSAAASATSGAGVGISPSLKPLLPAGAMTPNMDPTLPSPISPSVSGTSRTGPIISSSSSGPTVHVRKTSHKAAEQKRRDSLKTTFDDLRKLLPPIALPNDADADPNTITSPLFHATTPLLPGALPPRGPPKAGGEGPNKGVSKLQLLICGNEYIRLLKGRVDRRDDEIERLRREVGRLRLVAEGDESVAVEQEELDLGKDLDAVEKHAMSSRNGGGSHNHVNEGTAGNDMMDEGDDEGDD